jgi:hypothetical protein
VSEAEELEAHAIETAAVDTEYMLSDARAHAAGLVNAPTPARVDEFSTALDAYVVATRALRDAELAMKSAGERYRQALLALNQAVAPT